MNSSGDGLAHAAMGHTTALASDINLRVKQLAICTGREGMYAAGRSLATDETHQYPDSNVVVRGQAGELTACSHLCCPW